MTFQHPFRGALTLLRPNGGRRVLLEARRVPPTLRGRTGPMGTARAGSATCAEVRSKGLRTAGEARTVERRRYGRSL